MEALHNLPTDFGAVVSLCRVPDSDLNGAEHVEVRLIDRVGENPNLDYVLLDTVKAVERYRADGQTVLLHCVAAVSRTPTVAALYGARRAGITIDQALADVTAVLPTQTPTQSSAVHSSGCTHTAEGASASPTTR